MTNRIRWTFALALFAPLAVPNPAGAAMAAPSCTEGYERCLNDSWDTSGFTRMLADIECMAEYVGCVRKKLEA